MGIDPRCTSRHAPPITQALLPLVDEWRGVWRGDDGTCIAYQLWVPPT